MQCSSRGDGGNVSKTISNTYLNNTLYLLHMQCSENDVRHIKGMFTKNYKKYIDKLIRVHVNCVYDIA
jgi:hypothetical protein